MGWTLIGGRAGVGVVGGLAFEAGEFFGAFVEGAGKFHHFSILFFHMAEEKGEAFFEDLDSVIHGEDAAEALWASDLGIHRIGDGMIPSLVEFGDWPVD